MKKKTIFVTKPSLPPLKDLIPYLEQIWENKILTNNGPFHRQLEDALCNYLGVPYISLVSNATIGLIIALKALNIKGEVITTPYSYVATAHSLKWSKIEPIFVDIDPSTLNLDPKKIESAITPNTTAIMPVHVYGNPCDVDAIEIIAKKNNLKVIYDAAHAFGVKCHCGSILKHGDLSVLSFHATKVLNTFEGGAIISKDKKTKDYIDQIKNFGFTGETTVEQIGINGKMSEFNAALGLLQLKQIDIDIKKRQQIDQAYRAKLKDIVGIKCLTFTNMEKGNYSYFPIFVEEDYPLTRDQLYNKLKENDINGRRYFYPLITDFSKYEDMRIKKETTLISAKSISKKVICLPIYSELSINFVRKIINVIKL
jgi:dTDP-4-amino-4,6-dideoxygalactose transaminase